MFLDTARGTSGYAVTSYHDFISRFDDEDPSIVKFEEVRWSTFFFHIKNILTLNCPFFHVFIIIFIFFIQTGRNRENVRDTNY